MVMKVYSPEFKVDAVALYHSDPDLTLAQVARDLGIRRDTLRRWIEYRVDGGEVVRLLTDLLDPVAYPAAELAALYRERWEAESAFRQIKTFQRGPAEVLRSGDPDLVRQEVWAHLAVHHCL